MNITSDLFGLGIMQCLSGKDLERDRYVDLHADIDAVSQSSGCDLLEVQGNEEQTRSFGLESIDTRLEEDPVLRYLLEKRPQRRARTMSC
jgi:hypothetical protein